MPKRPVSPASLPAPEREARSRLHQLLSESEGFLHGSLIAMARRCGKPSCRCASDDRARHRSLCLGQTLGGKTTMVHIPADLEPLVRQWVDNFLRAEPPARVAQRAGPRAARQGQGQGQGQIQSQGARIRGDRRRPRIPRVHQGHEGHRSRQTQTSPQAILSRLLRYSEKIFALGRQWARTRDARSEPRLAPSLFPSLWFVMFAARLPSFNALVQLRRSRSLNRWLGTRRLPSAKELAIVSESIDPAPLRDCLGDIMRRLRRNKVLRPRHGLMLAAIDGHETHSSYKRCHEGSLEREITVDGRKVVQYYNRFTVFQVIGEGFYFLLDLEPVLPGEDEVASAMRLLARVLAAHPRCFDVLTCDAIYLRPSMIGMLRDANKHFVAVLKENQPELLDEARRLLPAEPPAFLTLPKAPGKSARRAELRQADGFTTGTIDTGCASSTPTKPAPATR